MPQPVNLKEKLASFSDHWSPRIVAEMNNHDIMLVKARGEFAWHRHADTDDLFLVLSGELDIELRNSIVTLGPGDLYVVPRGVEHRPVVRTGEAKLLLIEPQATPNSGNPDTAAARAVI